MEKRVRSELDIIKYKAKLNEFLRTKIKTRKEYKSLCKII